MNHEIQSWQVREYLERKLLGYVAFNAGDDYHAIARTIRIIRVRDGELAAEAEDALHVAGRGFAREDFHSDI
jgi:hypothetical protein